MKLKTISKILLAILVLTISIGVISAADNNATVLEAPTNNIDKNVLADHDWDDDDWDDDDDDDDDWDDDDRYKSGCRSNNREIQEEQLLQDKS